MTMGMTLIILNVCVLILVLNAHDIYSHRGNFNVNVAWCMVVKMGLCTLW